MTFDKNPKHYDYHGADCQEITIPNIGGAKAIIYDLKALNWALDTIKKQKLKNGVIYILLGHDGWPAIYQMIRRGSIQGNRATGGIPRAAL